MEDDKHLSGEEKRRKLKEEYLQDLRLRKQFLQEAERNKYMNHINRALSDMSQALEADDSDEWIAKLKGTALLQEAQLDMILEQQQTLPEPEDTTPEPPPTEEAPTTPGNKTMGDMEK